MYIPLYRTAKCFRWNVKCTLFSLCPMINMKRNNEFAHVSCLVFAVVCHVLTRFTYVWLFVTPWTVAHQAPLSMGFSRQEYWSGLPFPSPGDLLEQGMEPMSPVLQVDALPLSHLGNSYKLAIFWNFKVYTDFHSKQCSQPNPHIVNPSY